MEWLKRSGSGIEVELEWNGRRMEWKEDGMVVVWWKWNGMEVEQEVIWRWRWKWNRMEWNGFCINKL